VWGQRQRRHVARAELDARERAAALGLAHVEFRAGDVTTLPLSPHAYDVVLGRWSLNYVADVPGVLARLREALVPGGRIAVAAWAPPEANPWITIPMDALATVLPLPRPAPGAPGVFHLSADGALAGVLSTAGFADVRQERVQLSQFARDAAEFWAMLTETGGPFAPVVAQLSTGDRGRVLDEVARALVRFRTGDVFRIPAQAQLAWGTIRP